MLFRDVVMSFCGDHVVCCYVRAFGAYNNQSPSKAVTAALHYIFLFYQHTQLTLSSHTVAFNIANITTVWYCGDVSIVLQYKSILMSRLLEDRLSVY